MSHKTLTPPQFDKLELDLQPEVINRKYTPLQPLKAGVLLTDLHHHPLVVRSIGQQGGLSSSPALYSHKTLVLYFYSQQWGATGLQHLQQLQAISHQAGQHNSVVVVVDADGNTSNLADVLWQNNLQLPVYADAEHEIASRLGVYAEQSPAWNYYGGINSNVPLPAVFVLSEGMEILYDFSNRGIDSQLPAQDILAAAEGHHQYAGSLKKSA